MVTTFAIPLPDIVPNMALANYAHQRRPSFDPSGQQQGNVDKGPSPPVINRIAPKIMYIPMIVAARPVIMPKHRVGEGLRAPRP